MASFNRITLIGNLTRDPEMRNLPGGSVVCEFGIACNRKYKTQAGEDREDVLFIDCTAWGKQAEIIKQYCTKGKPLFIEGRLKLDTWEDKTSGGKRSKISAVVENFQFLGSRDNSGDGPPEADYPRNRSSFKRSETPNPIGEDREFREADIPF